MTPFLFEIFQDTAVCLRVGLSQMLRPQKCFGCVMPRLGVAGTNGISIFFKMQMLTLFVPVTPAEASRQTKHFAAEAFGRGQLTDKQLYKTRYKEKDFYIYTGTKNPHDMSLLNPTTERENWFEANSTRGIWQDCWGGEAPGECGRGLCIECGRGLGPWQSGGAGGATGGRVGNIEKAGICCDCGRDLRAASRPVPAGGKG